MSVNIDPEKFAELVVNANPAKSDGEDIAKRKQHSILMLTV